MIQWDQSSDPLACPQCGQVHASARWMKLSYGEKVPLHSEHYRRYCEAKWVLKKYRSRGTRVAYLQRIAERRGQQAADELRSEMLKVFKQKEEKKR